MAGQVKVTCPGVAQPVLLHAGLAVVAEGEEDGLTVGRVLDQGLGVRRCPEVVLIGDAVAHWGEGVVSLNRGALEVVGGGHRGG